MAKLTPTQLTLRALRQAGSICAIAERWNAHAGIRQDLFGWIDIVALDPARGIVGIQSTDGAHHAEHVQKLLNGPPMDNVIEWLACGGRVEVWSWRKVLLKRSGKAKQWAPRVRAITLGDYPGAEVQLAGEEFVEGMADGS